MVNAASSAPKTIKLKTSAVTKVSVDALFAFCMDPPDEDLTYMHGINGVFSQPAIAQEYVHF